MTRELHLWTPHEQWTEKIHRINRVQICSNVIKTVGPERLRSLVWFTLPCFLFSQVPVPYYLLKCLVAWAAFEVSMIFNDTLLCRFVGCNGGKQGWNKTEEILGEFSLHPSSYIEGEMPLVLFWILFLGQGVFLFFFSVYSF